jgi:hypothetical protein
MFQVQAGMEDDIMDKDEKPILPKVDPMYILKQPDSKEKLLT